MNRRSFLSTPVKKVSAIGDPPVRNKYANKKQPHFKDSASTTGIAPYTGPWGLTQVRHLLNRTMFGCTKTQLDAAGNMNMDSLVALILTPAATPPPPRYNYYNEATDPDCSPGGTWVNAPASPVLNGLRTQSLKDWWLQLMVEQGISIQEKMTMFLQNHVPIQFNSVPMAQYCYEYNVLCRSRALGNYKDFVREVSINKAMLIYLNGYKNQKNSPDENFARELQELFTVGKGPDSGYTEDDVKQAARVLTGYTIDLVNNVYLFNSAKHDTGNKQFSSFYGNAVITGQSGAAGEGELDELINLIFNQNEVAKHVVRNIYRWFVYYVIDPDIETNVIEPLADIFRTGGYEITPVLDVLLKSEHFYDSYNGGCVIKNPIDHNLGLVKNFMIELPDNSDLSDQYKGLRALNIFNFLLAMDPGDPPNVAGWEAYRSAPIYHEAWINSVTISYRNQLFEILLSPAGYTYKGIRLKIDYLVFTGTVANAEDPNLLISNLVDKFMSNPLTVAQVAALKSILLSGQLADYYWTDAWLNYVSDPGNASYKAIVDSRLYGFYRYFLSLVESQLI